MGTQARMIRVNTLLCVILTKKLLKKREFKVKVKRGGVVNYT